MIKQIITEHLKTVNFLLEDIEKIKSLCLECLETLNSGNKIILCGNGGSASDANHISAELVGKFEKIRRPLPAISLNDNLSTITAISNDFHFDQIFSRQIEAIGQPNDLLIAISTSGNSQNVLNAIQVSKSLGVKCIALTGNDGGEIANLDCEMINVKSDNTARIQEVHILIGHIICSYIDSKI
tara:strand:+ start:508 stop:1059 length:552 start_codon:yes stop_codon:yes gene_type:complete